ncbi:MAG TPA: NAD(P)H-hydrate epimerase, partial [Microbacterium sp.]|uniref:NAD(P)H-hydrate epimerase n=1 Tax=Microbacterium sp. TaxID=51671 RepID=UPI002B46344C
GRGVGVDIVRTADRVHQEALEAALAAGARVVDLDEAVAGGHDLVLDGMLGIGARGALRGRAREAAAALLPASPRVVAVDLPSGLDPDEGTSDGVVLPATITVTFGAAKAGLTRADGVALSGRIVLVELGLALPAPVAEARVAEIRQG